MTWPLYSALFGWLALTDGYTGHYTWVLTLNGVFSVILVCFALLKSPKPKPLTPYLFAFLAIQTVSFFYNHSTDVYPLWRTVVWMAVYHLPWSKTHLRTGAFYAGMAYAGISPFLSTNTNIIAFNLWTLYFLSQRRDIWFGVLVFVAMLMTKSEGGLLALGLGVAYRQFGARVLVLSPVALFGIIALKYLGIYGGNSIVVRIRMVQHAFNGLLKSPWIGNYDSFDFLAKFRHPILYHDRFMLLDGDAPRYSAWHAHNIIADIGFQTGIIGLLILLAVGVMLYHKRRTPTAFSVAFLAHSMVDSPVWFFLPAVGLFMELAYNDNPTRFVWRADWLNIRRYRFGARVAGQASLGVDTRPPAGRPADAVD